MSAKKIQISSEQFGELSQNILAELKNDQDFLDVTLVCDGDQQIQAHKVVLASFSQFFKNILRRNPHQHPLIYLKGVDMENLKAILSFIYTGEVTVNQESLDKILQSSRDLEIKGLFEDQIEKGNENISQENMLEKDHNGKGGNIDDDFQDYEFIEKEGIKTEAVEDETNKITTREEFQQDDGNDDKSGQHDLKIKKERCYSCDQCDFTGTHSGVMWRHKSTAHMNQSFPCDQCSHTTNRKDSLLRHKRNKHSLNVSV